MPFSASVMRQVARTDMPSTRAETMAARRSVVSLFMSDACVTTHGSSSAKFIYCRYYSSVSDDFHFRTHIFILSLHDSTSRGTR